MARKSAGARTVVETTAGESTPAREMASGVGEPAGTQASKIASSAAGELNGGTDGGDRSRIARCARKEAESEVSTHSGDKGDGDTA
jgi:hypothetical protein